MRRPPISVQVCSSAASYVFKSQVEIAYNTREMINRVDNFRMWLYDNDIKHETSAAGDFVHFEILLSKEEVEEVNNALDVIVWFDSIVNK